MALLDQNTQVEDGEISLLDIVNFVQESWKKLAIAAIAGGILGFANWFFSSSYSAKLVLINNGGVELVALRSLQKTLPNLANQIVDEGKVPQGQESLYRTLSNPEWGLKNIVPTFGMSKAETKDLASTVGLESAGSLVSSLVITAGGASKEQALENALLAKNFFLQGASYLALRSIFNEQESQLLSKDAGIAQKMNAIQIELGYQQERLKSLEALAKRFSGDTKVSVQVVDPKDSGAKYLPISTQIIAANTDINSSKEALERLKNDQVQMGTLRTWVKKISPLMDATFDGVALNKQLLEQEALLRASLNSSEPKSLIFVDDLRATLIANSIRYSKGFEMNIAPTTSGKRGMIKTTVAGLAGAFFLVLLVLVGQRVWLNVKSSGAK
jgi:hypothetical protein